MPNLKFAFTYITVMSLAVITALLVAVNVASFTMAKTEVQQASQKICFTYDIKGEYRPCH